MPVADKKDLTMHEPDAGQRRDEESRRDSGGSGETPRAERAISPLELYKPGQGTVMRWCTAAAAGVLSVWFCATLSSYLTVFRLSEWLVIFIPVIVLVGLGVMIFRLAGQNPRFSDFLIATEGEMKKVNWSTRREVLGATKVVIVLILVLGLILFLVDVAFMSFFAWIGVLKVDFVGQMFKSRTGG